MTIVTPTPIPAPPALPQRSDQTTFEDRADAFFDWQHGDLASGIDAQSQATYANALDAQESAQAADASALSAQVARNKSQDWAEGTEPEIGSKSSKEWSDVSQSWAEGLEPAPGSQSAKSWASAAEGYKDSAEVAAAAAQSAAGLPALIGNSGKSLVVKTDETGVEFGSPFPDISSKRGHALVVGASGPEWVPRISELTRVEIGTSQTWTPPYYPFPCRIEMAGGGAGGGGGWGTNTIGGGGGGSGYFEAVDVLLTEGQNIQITIGAGGDGGSGGGGGSSANAGQDGGTTTVTVGSESFTALGGKAGTYFPAGGDGGSGGGGGSGRITINTTTVQYIYTSGGNGGSGTSGFSSAFTTSVFSSQAIGGSGGVSKNLITPIGSGGKGGRPRHAENDSVGGGGGGGLLYAGGNGGSNGNAPSIPVNKGGGGGGGGGGASGHGRAGAPGIVFIYYYA